MPSAKFPINVNLESIDGAIDRAKIVNGYAEVASQNEVKVYSRPALTLAQGSFAAFGQGIAQLPSGKAFVVSGGSLYFPVPGLSNTVLSTHSGGQIGFFRANGDYVYAISQGSNGVVYRAASPYTTFGSIGTHGGNDLSDATVFNGTLFTINQSGLGIRKSVDGITWSAASNSPSLPTGRLTALNGTLFAHQHSLSSGAAYNFTVDGGATAWGTGTVTFTGTAQGNYIAGTHNDRMWAVAGNNINNISYSEDGSTWVVAGTSPGWSNMANPTIGSVFASLNGVMYVAVFQSGPVYEIWASSDNGVTWSEVESISVASTSTDVQVLAVGSVLYAALPNSSAVYSFYKLLGDGSILGTAAVASLEIGAGEIVSIIGTETLSFVKSTTAAYTISNGVTTRVTDAQYPTVTVRGAVYLNGRLYVMEPDGTIWNSAEDDFTAWAGTDFITAEFEADGGVCLAKHGEYVVALGQFTTEAFYDAGNASGSPLDPVGSAVMLIGCAHANSVAQVENSLVWVAQQKGQGSTFHKGRFVVIMKGYGSYDRISTPDVERVLDKDAFTEVYADILTVAGHVFYVITLVDSDITLAYDFRSQLWYEWSLQTAQSAQAITSITGASALATAILASHGYSDGDQVVVTGGTGTFTAVNGTHNINVVNSGTFTYPISSSFSGTCTTGTGQGWTSGALDISASCYFNNDQLVQLRETGDVYVLEGTGVSDNGAPIDFRIRTRNWDAGTNREKFMGSLEVVGDKVNSTGLVRYSDDDFQTYTKFKRVDLSLRRPRSRRGGSFSRRAVEFRHTLSAKVGISALEADIEMGEQ